MFTGMKWARITPLVVLFVASVSYAQNNNGDSASALAGCGCCGTFIFVPIIVLFVLHIALLVFVARDAKARGMDGAVIWMLLVFFLPLIGILIYMLSRPKGDLVSCPNCGNNRLQVSVRCPHCGIGS